MEHTEVAPGASTRQDSSRILVTVRGRCLDVATELPVTRTTVSAADVSASTSRDGEFEIETPCAGDARLRVIAEGYYPRILPIEARHDLDLGIVWLRPQEWIRGYVTTAGGAPAPGATVMWIDSRKRVAAITRSDAAGAFRVGVHATSCWETGDVRIAAWHEQGGVGFAIASDPARRIDVQLRGGQPVSGIVVDSASGLPVAGARYSLQPDGVGGDDSLLRIGETDETGGFRLAALSPGSARIVFVHPEYARAVVAAPGGGIRVSLSPAGVLRGVVAMADGSPARGVTVNVHASEEIQVPSAEVDGSGRFEVHGVPRSAPFRVIAHAEVANAVLAFERLPETAIHIELKCDSVLRVGWVHVVDAHGRPLPGMEVRCHNGAKPTPGRVSNEAGWASFWFRKNWSGSFAVTASGRGLWGSVPEGLVYPNWPEDGIEVVMRPALAIRGRLVGFDKRSPPLVRLLLDGEEALPVHAAVPDENGRFSLSAPRECVCLVAIGESGRTKRLVRLTTPATGPVELGDIEPRPQRPIFGRVTRQDGRPPAANSAVLCRPLGIAPSMAQLATLVARTNRDGYFRFEDVPPLPLELTVDTRAEGSAQLEIREHRDRFDLVLSGNESDR